MVRSAPPSVPFGARAVPDALPVNAALDRADVLRDLQRRIQDSKERLAAVRGLVPPALSSRLMAGPVDETGWTLIAPSSAVAAKLRQLQPRLEAALRQRGWQVSAIRIRIQQSSGG